MKDELPISYDELLKELEQAREPGRTKITFNPQQQEFILAARDNERPVSYDRLVTLWKKAGWGKIARSTLALEYKRLKEESS